VPFRLSNWNSRGPATAAEAAAELNVSRATLYAYVSRGLVQAMSVEGRRSKLYAAEGLQASLLREQVAEEKRAFVRGKKVFIVLEPDLDHILAERFQFDRMEQLHRFHNLADARKSLEGGKGRGIVEYFEREGYDLVWEVLDSDERDRVLLAVLGQRLPALLLKEIETVKPLVSHLEEGDLESLFYNLPEPVVDAVLAALQERSYEKFLAVVPARIREAVILDFLAHADRVREAWQGIGAAEQKEVLASQAPWLHGTIFLLDSTFSKRKFPALKFDFERNYSSSMLAKMGPEQQKATYSTIVRSMEASGVPKGLLARQLKPEELERFVVENYVPEQKKKRKRQQWAKESEHVEAAEHNGSPPVRH